MGNLFIIPCGRKKVWDSKPETGAVPTKYAYIGTFHNLCERYAESFGDKWVVLSGKHGYLLPEDIVNEPYDVTFNHSNNSVVSISRLEDQVNQKGLGDFSTVTALTGKKYKPYIERSFYGQNVIIHYPLENAKGIGFMQKMLKEAVEKNEPIS